MKDTPVKITVTVQNAVLSVSELEHMRKSLRFDLETCDTFDNEVVDYKMKTYIRKKRNVVSGILRKLKYQQRELQRQQTKYVNTQSYNIKG